MVCQFQHRDNHLTKRIPAGGHKKRNSNSGNYDEAVTHVLSDGRCHLIPCYWTRETFALCTIKATGKDVPVLN
jgi:hypothetical protein